MRRFFLPAFVLFVLIVMPLSAQAAPATFFGPIVPPQCNCENVDGMPTAPSYGCVLEVIQRLVNFGVTIGILAATFALVYAGFVWMTNGSNPEARSKGRTLLINVFVGLAILLAAWLLIDFIMKKIYIGEGGDADYMPWNSILASNGNDVCMAPTTPTKLGGILGGALTGELAGGSRQTSPGGVQGTKGCPTCVSLATYGISCKNNCTLDPNVAPRLATLKSNFSGNWIVTEAYPPTSTHTNQCHYNGTCVDAAFTGSTAYSADSISAFSAAAKKSGLRPVFETFDCGLRDQARARGVTAYCKSDNGYGHITGSHFSLYAN